MHHFGITVSDLDRSVAFYTDYFGLEEVKRNHLFGETISESVGVPEADLTVAHLASENTILELLQYRSPTASSYSLDNSSVGAAHACVTVTEIDALYERMTADGVKAYAPVREFEEQTKMFYCLDPDKISVEVLEPGLGLQLQTLLARGSA